MVAITHSMLEKKSGMRKKSSQKVGYAIFIEALKMAEKHEKPCFTFFAFLPPYFGVSGSLVSRMRKISMRSIDWYRKFLISCLAARYSAIFVFFIVKIEFLKLNLLPNRAVESFWDALWLGIRPFFYFCRKSGKIQECRRGGWVGISESEFHDHQ